MMMQSMPLVTGGAPSSAADSGGVSAVGGRIGFEALLARILGLDGDPGSAAPGDDGEGVVPGATAESTLVPAPEGCSLPMDGVNTGADEAATVSGGATIDLADALIPVQEGGTSSIGAATNGVDTVSGSAAAGLNAEALLPADAVSQAAVGPVVANAAGDPAVAQQAVLYAVQSGGAVAAGPPSAALEVGDGSVTCTKVYRSGLPAQSGVVGTSNVSRLGDAGGETQGRHVGEPLLAEAAPTGSTAGDGRQAAVKTLPDAAGAVSQERGSAPTAGSGFPAGNGENALNAGGSSRSPAVTGAANSVVIPPPQGPRPADGATTAQAGSGAQDAPAAAGQTLAAPPSAPGPPAVPTLDPAQVVQQAMRHLDQMREHPGRPVRVEIAIDPPHLGPVTVKLSLVRGELTAHFFTPDGAVRDAIQSVLPQLREQLAQHQLQLGQAEVFLGNGDSSPGRQYSAWRQEAAPGWAGNEAFVIPDPDPPPNAAAPPGKLDFLV